jgi:glycosyltransferase involved in cell wall biosynthesis
MASCGTGDVVQEISKLVFAMKKKKILVIGQTPPPYGGQALMTKRLVEATFDSVDIIHVRLGFSENFLEVGKASWKKVFHVFAIAARVLKQRIRNNDLALYYMPAGPNKVPVFRDLLLLSLIRPFFSKTIYHFRAAGISEFIRKKNRLFRSICKWIYGRPTIAIQLSSLNPEDARFFSAKSIYYIPNGIEDCAIRASDSNHDVSCRTKETQVFILFVGVLREDKGFSWLLDSLHQLVRSGSCNFHLSVMGEFSSKLYKEEIEKKLALLQLTEYVTFLGVKTGGEKWKYFSKADFLCFPTYFDCESFGNVLLEAMMFRLPVVTSQWRGIPDIVTEDTGFIVPVKDVEMLAERIKVFIDNPDIRKRMGENARRRFLEFYTLDKYLTRIEAVFSTLND